MAQLFQEAMKGAASYCDTKTTKTIDRKGGKNEGVDTITNETHVKTGKTQHAECWKIDRQLGEIDKAIVDQTIFLYGRDWRGFEELKYVDMREKMPKAESGKPAAGGMSNDELQMSRESQSPKFEAGVAAVATPAVKVEPVPSPAYSVPGTWVAAMGAMPEWDDSEVILAEAIEEPAPIPEALVPEPAASPSPESAIRNPQSAIEKPKRPPAISKITGLRIEAPR